MLRILFLQATLQTRNIANCLLEMFYRLQKQIHFSSAFLHTCIHADKESIIDPLRSSSLLSACSFCSTKEPIWTIFRGVTPSNRGIPQFQCYPKICPCLSTSTTDSKIPVLKGPIPVIVFYFFAHQILLFRGLILKMIPAPGAHPVYVSKSPFL